MFKSAPTSPALVFSFPGVLLGLVLLGWQNPEPAEPPREFRSEFYHDFRGRPLPSELKPMNPGDEQCFRVEPEGLRITIPRTWNHANPGVGLNTTFGLRGDFEATLTLEVLHLERPPAGYGAGPGICVETGIQRAYLQRFITFPGGKHIVQYGGRRPDPVTKQPRWFQNGPPCEETLLRLRLKRAEDWLTYWWAPGAVGGDFQEVPWSRSKDPFGTEPVQFVRLFGSTGQNPCLLDFRLIEFRISTGQPVTEPAPAAPPTTGGKGWLAIPVLLGLVILLSVGVWVAIRQKHQTWIDPGAAAGLNEPGQAEPIPLSLSFACPGCGKPLKARAALAGKQVLCPQCGQATSVPGLEGGEAAAGSW